MSLRRWLRRMMGHTEVAHDDAARVLLAEFDTEQVDRLVRLTGKSREQVREDAARRAELALRLSVRRR